MAQERIGAKYQHITIETVDTAIHSWFDKILNVWVKTPTSGKRKVPVVFGSGERFVTSRQKKGIRDKDGMLILPIISVRRTNIDQSKRMSAAGIEVPNIKVSKIISGKTSVIQNAIAKRGSAVRNQKDKVVHEIMTIPYPDFSIASYELVIQAQYITQMNEILEKFFNKLNFGKSFVALVNDNEYDAKSTGVQFEDRKKMKGYYFVCFLDNSVKDDGNFEEFTDIERIVKYSLSFEVPMYLLLDPSDEKPAIRIERTYYDVDFSDERVCFVDDMEDLIKIFE